MCVQVRTERGVDTLRPGPHWWDHTGGTKRVPTPDKVPQSEVTILSLSGPVCPLSTRDDPFENGRDPESSEEVGYLWKRVSPHSSLPSPWIFRPYVDHEVITTLPGCGRESTQGTSVGNPMCLSPETGPTHTGGGVLRVGWEGRTGSSRTRLCAFTGFQCGWRTHRGNFGTCGSPE